MAELKPCPFCGGEKLKIDKKSVMAGYNGLDDRVEQRTFSVRCNSCHARGGTVGGKVIPYWMFRAHDFEYPKWATTDDVLKSEAIKAWNRRADNG